MDKCIVDRSKWLRGDVKNSALLASQQNNKMCCMGFYSLQVLNLKKEDIEDVPAFIDIPLDTTNINGKLQTLDQICNGGGNFELKESIYWVNDTDKITDAEREEKLKILVREKLNCEMEFVD